jgi:hypothetical protein
MAFYETSSGQTKRAVMKALLIVVSLAVMASIGGGFVLGLVLLPLHWRAARSASVAGRILWAGLAAALVAENVWGAYFVLFGESQPLVWLAPTVAFVLTATAFLRPPRRDAPVPA